jgi:cell wall-associated NlpC family hydrolase
MTREQVQEEARKWLRTPYRARGRSSAGLDCIGVLVMVGRSFNVRHVDRLDYSNWPAQDHLILKELGQYLDRLPISSELPGTIGVFAEKRLPGHAGIFSEKYGVTHLIHARVLGRRVLEEPWARMPRHEIRLIGLFCFPGLEL